MGLNEDPIIDFDPLGPIDHSKVEHIYIFGAVGESPNITVNNGEAVAGNNTHLFFETDAFSNIHNVQFYVPGFWNLRAAVLYNGEVFYSDIVEMEIWFPSVYEMEQDSELHSAMESLWQSTLDAAGPNSRREMGFWIYTYIGSGNSLKFKVVEDPPGPITVGCVGTNASILPSPPVTEFPDHPYDEDVKYYVGYFHTHTPMRYCTTGSRDTGLSPGDEIYATSNNIPVLL